MLAKPLSELIPDLRADKKVTITICNILDVYDKQFDPDTIYNIFRNYYEIEEMLQTKKEKVGDIQMVLYSLDGERWLQYPRNINSFVFDCHEVWNVELEFDKILQINNFELD